MVPTAECVTTPRTRRLVFRALDAEHHDRHSSAVVTLLRRSNFEFAQGCAQQLNYPVVGRVRALRIDVLGAVNQRTDDLLGRGGASASHLLGPSE